MLEIKINCRSKDESLNVYTYLRAITEGSSAVSSFDIVVTEGLTDDEKDSNCVFLILNLENPIYSCIEVPSIFVYLHNSELFKSLDLPVDDPLTSEDVDEIDKTIAILESAIHELKLAKQKRSTDSVEILPYTEDEKDIEFDSDYFKKYGKIMIKGSKINLSDMDPSFESLVKASATYQERMAKLRKIFADKIVESLDSKIREDLANKKLQKKIDENKKSRKKTSLNKLLKKAEREIPDGFYDGGW